MFQIACEVLAVRDELQMNLCLYRDMKLDLKYEF